jgi:hypothetical protein
MAISNLLTGRVRVISPKNVTQDRYQFLDLSQAEPNLGVPNFSASLFGSPAIVVSDDQGNRGFVRSLDLDRVTGQFTGSFSGSAELSGSFSGSFFGDGAGLFNLPEAVKLASGSATASISPNRGFDINTGVSINDFLIVTGSTNLKGTTTVENNLNVENNLDVTENAYVHGDLYVDNTIYAEQLIVSYISSSVIYSSGSNIFGDSLLDRQQMTGSVTITGSLNVDSKLVFGQATGSTISSSLVGEFVGRAQATGSFSGSFTGSFFGDGRNLFNLPETTKIATGSVTASVTPDRGFLVQSAVSGSEFTGSVNVSGSISASFFIGDGSQLINVPSVVSPRISNGNVTASVSPDFGFKVESLESGSQFTGSVNISGSISIPSGSGFFSGSGRGLFDIPRAAFAPDALTSNLLFSGSVTASVSPDFGFKVQSEVSGSEFTGSVDISGSLFVSGTLSTSQSILLNAYSGALFINSSSVIYGDGQFLRNIPRSALTEDALISTEIKSGSVTASVSPTFGFRVESVESGSQFTGSVNISGSLFINPYSGSLELASGSSYYGEGTYLRNIPRSALTEDALISNEIKSGSVTASVSPDFGFKVVSQESGSQLTGSVQITGSLFITATSGSLTLGSSSVYYGEGTYLRNIPRSALTEDALISTEIKSGSVTASVSPDFGFVVNSAQSGSEFTGSVSVSGSISASIFQGDGAGLFNIPLSALAEEVLVTNQISTGSVTASVSPDFGFKVESAASGSEFTGSINVTGSVIVESGSIYVGDGSGLRNIPLSALNLESFTANRIASGSVTASVAPSTGLLVSSAVSGSTFTGSLFVSGNINIPSGSGFFSGSGEGLFNIPLSALNIDSLIANRIASGSVTASVSPDDGFKVVSIESGSQFTGSLFVSGNVVIPSGSGFFSGSGRGLFDIPLSALADEVLISTTLVSGSITASVSPNFGFRVESAESGSEFTGSVTISGSLEITATSGSLILGSSSAYFGEGTYLRNIPRSALTEDALLSTFIASGSVTASVSPVFGFRVESQQRGSEFTGSVDVLGNISASMFSGSGRGLFDIPRSALADDALTANLIFSGSATASISPNRGLQINVDTTIDGNLYVSESIYAQSLIVTYISSSIIYSSGSNKFGDANEDRQEFTGSIDVSGSIFAYGNIQLASGSAFSGSGRNLFDIPRSAFATEALLVNEIKSGSVTASAIPTQGFVVESAQFGTKLTGSLNVSGSVLAYGNIQVASGSFFSGSGEGLFNIPLSALAEEVLVSTKLASGSITASVSPVFGFKVESIASGSEFTGSVDVSGSIFIPSGSGFFSGSGIGLFDIPRSALSPDALESTLISSGSVTASVSPNFGFKVQSAASGSEFTGSIDVSGSIFIPSGSGFFSGSGIGLFDIPQSALSFELFRIASGSATASISPNRGFEVNTFSKISGSLIVSSSAREIPTSSLKTSFNVVNVGSVSYSIDGQSNPRLKLVRGVTYTFNMFAPSYPFWIKTTKSIGQINAYNNGITNNGSAVGTITVTLPNDAPNILYYNDESNASMSGIIDVVDAFIIPNEITFIGDTNITGTLDVSSDIFAYGNIELASGSAFSGSGRNLFDIPLSAFTGDAFRIASGSITASVSPNFGFRVQSSASGSEFTGSVDVSGSFVALEISASKISGSFVGDGSGLTNLPSATRIASGSATASISPIEGFVVNTFTAISGNLIVSASGRFDVATQTTTPAEIVLIGETHISGNLLISGGFGGYVWLQTGSFFSGSGRGLFDIPRTALTEDALVSTEIKSGSVTASVSPNFGFRVQSSASGSEFTGSVDVSGSVSVSSGSFFIGDGRFISNISVANLAIDSTKIFSGSATASIAPNTGLLVNTGATISNFLIVTGSSILRQVSGSFFSGSGRDLFDIPRSALSEEVFRIASGSVTASVSPVFGFKVQSAASGSEFTGSVDVSGSIFIPSGSGFFSGSGRGLFDIPRSALTEDALISTEIKSGSVTASVSPDFGFKVVSQESGSQFTGSINISGSLFVSPFSGSIQLASGSSYYGDARYLRNIPRAALTEDALISAEIKSGSVTASVSPNFGFRVESAESGSEFTGSVDISGSLFINAVSGGVFLASSSAYYGEGTYLRNIPRSALTEDALVSAEIKSGSVTASVSPNFGFRVESAASGSEFTGSIDVSGSITLISGSFFSGSGEGLFNIPRAAFAPDALTSNLLFSGSVTASVSPNFGFNVNSNVTVEGGLYVSQSSKLQTTEITGALYLTGSEFIAGDLYVDGKIVTTELIAQFISSSIIYSSGSNIFGDSTLNTQQLTGSVLITGSLDVQNKITFVEASGSSVSASFTGSFFGDGRNLRNVQSAIESAILASGSVTASVAGDILIINAQSASFLGGVQITGSLNLTTGSIVVESGSIIGANAIITNFTASSATGSFTGSFFGDGTNLFNLPEATKLASGSVTASVSPEFGFKVITPFTGSDYGSEFTGSVDVSGSVRAFAFIGDGSQITNVQAAAAPFIASGSATASVANGVDFRVITSATGSQIGSEFTGSVEVSGSLIADDLTARRFILGDGRFITNVVASAAPFIGSGSATASVANGFDFRVITAATGSEIGSEFTGSVAVSGSLFVNDDITADFYFGDGRFLTNVQAAAAPLISSGSATASVASGERFIVETSPESGSYK